MPPFKTKNHDENRKLVCFFCGKKAARQLGQPQIDHIKTFYAEFDAHRHLLPCGICNSCRVNKPTSGQLKYEH